MKILIAPAHYILDTSSGSEYTRAYECVETIGMQKKVSGDILVAFCKAKKIGNLNVISYCKKKPQFITNTFRLKFIFWVYSTARKLMKENEYDCVWHLGPFAIGETFSLVALRDSKLPFFLGPIYTPLTEAGKDDFGLYGNKTHTTKSIFGNIKYLFNKWTYGTAKIFYPLSVRTMKKAQKIFVIDANGKALLNKMGIKNVEILNIGIHTSNFKKMKRKKPPQEIVRLLAISYFVYRKRVHEILYALRKTVFQMNNHKVKLTVIGDGPQKKMIHNLAKNLMIEPYIDFKGRIPREEIAKEYQNADVFVSASVSESMSGVYLEAMASGLPLLVVSNETTRILKKNKFGGILVPPNRPEKMAHALKMIISDKKTRLKMGAQNAKLAEDSFDLKQTSSALMQNFLKVDRTNGKFRRTNYVI